MAGKRIAAVLVLLGAAGIFVAQRPDLLPSIFPKTPIPSAEASKAREIVGPVISRCTKRQRAELAAFYASAARAVPKLARHDPNLTTARMRSILELAVRVQFAGEWERVPGLADAIHGPNGAIAQLYGLDQGKLDADKFARTLAGIAEAIQP